MLSVVLLATLAPAARAQACNASPALDGGYAFRADAAISGDYTGFAATVAPNLGVVFGGLTAVLDTWDYEYAPNGYTLGATIGHELPPAVLSVCPVAGVWYSSVGNSSFWHHSWTFPVGLRAGKRVDFEDGLYLIPSLVGQFVHFRFSAAYEQWFGDGYMEITESGSGNEFMGGVEVTLGWRAFFAGVGAIKNTADGSSAAFKLWIGVVAGR